MPSVTHFNSKAGSPPYRSLFSNVSIVPPNTALAYISTQWAADPATGELYEGMGNNYGEQSKVIWTNIIAILKELGAAPKDIVHKSVQFKDFNDDIGKDVVEAQMSVVPDEWKADSLASSLTFEGVAHFHRPGVVYAVDLVVAVPNK